MRDLIGDDQEAAYKVQQVLIGRRLDAGAAVVGRKIGLTSQVVQRQLGVDQPDFGVLLNDMQVETGGIADLDRLLQPRIEAEIAFVLEEDIDDLDATASSVRNAVAYAVGALEIVDSRIAGWDITYSDTVADNASSGLFVLGTERLPLRDVEPRDLAMSLSIGGAERSSGRGADCLGDPLNALAWLAATAARLGEPLRAGQIVLSGALGPMVPVDGGDRVEASISCLGTVSVGFERQARI